MRRSDKNNCKSLLFSCISFSEVSFHLFFFFLIHLPLFFFYLSIQSNTSSPLSPSHRYPPSLKPSWISASSLYPLLPVPFSLSFLSQFFFFLYLSLCHSNFCPLCLCYYDPIWAVGSTVGLESTIKVRKIFKVIINRF